MGKGLAALTFDEDYQRKRRQGMNNKPKNFHEGLARSGKGLVMVSCVCVCVCVAANLIYILFSAGLCGRRYGRGDQTSYRCTRGGR